MGCGESKHAVSTANTVVSRNTSKRSNSTKNIAPEINSPVSKPANEESLSLVKDSGNGDVKVNGIDTDVEDVVLKNENKDVIGNVESGVVVPVEEKVKESEVKPEAIEAEVKKEEPEQNIVPKNEDQEVIGNVESEVVVPVEETEQKPEAVDVVTEQVSTNKEDVDVVCNEMSANQEGEEIGNVEVKEETKDEPVGVLVDVAEEKVVVPAEDVEGVSAGESKHGVPVDETDGIVFTPEEKPDETKVLPIAEQKPQVEEESVIAATAAASPDQEKAN
jgi:hypothetical protein